VDGWQKVDGPSLMVVVGASRKGAKLAKKLARGKVGKSGWPLPALLPALAEKQERVRQECLTYEKKCRIIIGGQMSGH
jgi:hypothetical protein